MVDPLSAAASIAGLLSLGIQVFDSLYTFYTDYQDQDSNIARITSRLGALSETFKSLDQAICSRSAIADEQALIAKIHSSIENCRELILELQQETKKFSAQPKGSIGATVKTASHRIAYPFRKSTLMRLDEYIECIREDLSFAIDVLHLNDCQDMRDNLHDTKLVLELIRTSQISQKVLEWLKAPDPTTNYNQACDERYSTSGLWFVKGPSFTKWLEESGSFLWLNGFAGCGKSVLSSTAIKYTLRRRQSNPRIGIAFFYFSFQDDAKQDVSGLLRAVLLQLANQSKDTETSLVHLYNSHKNGEPPIPILKESVRQALQRFQDVYLILDALDESPRPDARERVLNMLTDIRGWSLNGLHILVTSRDEPDIRDSLDPSATEDISMKNEGVDRDIENFIQGYLETTRAMQKWSAHHAKIKETLSSKADGV